MIPTSYNLRLNLGALGRRYLTSSRAAIVVPLLPSGLIKLGNTISEIMSHKVFLSKSFVRLVYSTLLIRSKQRAYYQHWMVSPRTSVLKTLFVWFWIYGKEILFSNWLPKSRAASERRRIRFLENS